MGSIIYSNGVWLFIANNYITQNIFPIENYRLNDIEQQDLFHNCQHVKSNKLSFIHQRNVDTPDKILTILITFYDFYWILEHVDIDEAKSFFESNYSHVYFILYDTFVQAETNLRQRGKKKTNFQ